MYTSFFLTTAMTEKNRKFIFYYCTTLNKSGEEPHTRTPAF